MCRRYHRTYAKFYVAFGISTLACENIPYNVHVKKVVAEIAVSTMT